MSGCVIRTPNELRAWCAKVEAQLTDKRAVEVFVYPHYQKRTPAQNRTWHWGKRHVARHLAQYQYDHGLDVPQLEAVLHEEWKRLFVPPKAFDILGHEIVVQSTTLCSTVELATAWKLATVDSSERWGFEMPEPIPQNVREEISDAVHS